MSNAEFQARLQRIGANSGQQSMVQGVIEANQPHSRKPHYGLLAAGALLMSLGIQAVKFANRNYEAIRESSGVAAAAGLGLAAIALLLIAGLLMMRAITKRRSASAGADGYAYAASDARTAPQPSTGARVFSSLMGFAFGAIASFYMFVAGAARFVDTETAQTVAKGGGAIALLLLAASLLLGLLGLFLRGSALRRVPIYFFCGGALTFAAFRLLRVNLLDWPQFVAQLH